MSGKGGMASVLAPADQVRERIGKWSDVLAVAAVNSPGSCAVAGDPATLDKMVAEFEAEGVRARRIPGVDTAGHSPQVDGLREQLLADMAPVLPTSSQVPFFSTVTGELFDTAGMGAEYWYRNMREPVEFEAALRAALPGTAVVVEVSPHPVLSVAISEVIEDAASEAGVVGSLRRDEGGLDRVARSLGEAWTHGAPVDWSSVVPSGALVDLPTYPFQRQRYWLDVPEVAGDPAGYGLGAADHPLLGAVVALADSDGLLLTGRLSLRTHDWLADHAVWDTVLLPGTAFVELAAHAGARVGCEAVEDLTLEAPLLFTDDAVSVQITVGAPDDTGARPVSIHSRADDDEPWTRHATGTLTATPATPDFDLTAWPPPGAEPVDVTALYPELAAAGLAYGPVFQGLRAAWRDGTDVCAEVALPEDTAAAGFGLHPALLDAALHATAATAGAEDSGRMSLPFAWRGVRVHATGAGALRVRLSPVDGGVALRVADAAGLPVATVEQLAVRPVTPDQLLPAASPLRDALFQLDWVPLTAGAADTRPLDTHVVPASAEGSAAEATALTGLVLSRLQEWLADPATADRRLAVVTRGAAAVAGSDATDLAHAAVWGLVRSAQSEHPDRLVLVDLEADTGVEAVVPTALATGEPQVAVRGGTPHGPRLARPAAPEEGAGWSFTPGGTVLVTGALGTIGALVARHLVTAHGVRHLLLTSRRGAAAPGAAELVAELADLGATATVAACDTADREAVDALIASVPAEHPLTAVVHSAGVLDDGVLTDLTPESLERVMRPKAHAALNLHESTKDLDLTAFVLFSSAAGVFGNPGQANYAAANAFLDAFAAHRRSLGLPATSVAWGYWADRSGMTGDLVDADLDRIARAGIGAITTGEGLSLFDAVGALDSSARDRALLAPVKLDLPALRAQAGPLGVPPLLSGLIRALPQRTTAAPAGADALRRRLAGVPDAERGPVVLAFVREQVAAVLGMTGPEAVAPTAAFPELGFDSLTAVELRNRLGAAAGVRLPTTVVFEHPTPAALAEHLAGLVTDAPGATRAPVGEASTFGPMAKKAIDAKRLQEFVGLLVMASSFRPTFTDPAEVGRPQALVPVAAGPAEVPTLVCVPSVLAMSGPHEYARFAAALRGTRPVSALPLPGFLPGERMPATIDALIRSLADTLLRDLGGAPFALAAHSSGGPIAHALAGHLETLGSPPSALALIDTYPRNQKVFNGIQPKLADGMAGEDNGVGGDLRMTAMGGYFDMFGTWNAKPITTPTLLLRAADPLPAWRRDSAWRATWKLDHTSEETPGDHFSMMDEHAATTALRVHEWVTTQS
ncbi:SDR family NAD(P)-dependent oxidoreductase [Actinokineospora spheciospongiae]|uniref:SDR family NAD(P)-dependent oxidoreductase n=1 Tax=Actinokineospora spheciospongiae TaxID=909613 RepID=UPI002277275D|nr:SDR family NAD(P)-dependent oxidoreductase [Actinokineospora spheciospongiae]